MKELSKQEVEVVLAGKAMPGELLVGESLAKYFARLYLATKESRDAQIAALAKQKPVGSFHIYDGKVDGTTDYVRDGEWPIDEGELLVYARAAPVVPFDWDVMHKYWRENQHIDWEELEGAIIRAMSGVADE